MEGNVIGATTVKSWTSEFIRFPTYSLLHLGCQEWAAARRVRHKLSTFGTSISRPRAAQFCQPLKGFAEIFTEQLLTLGILFKMLSETCVPQKHHVCNKHHLMSSLTFYRAPGCLIPAPNYSLRLRQTLGWRKEQCPFPST